MDITALHRRCSDGTCPAVYDTGDPALIAVQGSALAGPRADLGDVPAHEVVVVLPWSLLDSCAGERR
jgi:hypothetical protein